MYVYDKTDDIENENNDIEEIFIERLVIRWDVWMTIFLARA